MTAPSLKRKNPPTQPPKTLFIGADTGSSAEKSHSGRPMTTRIMTVTANTGRQISAVLPALVSPLLPAYAEKKKKGKKMSSDGMVS